MDVIAGSLSVLLLNEEKTGSCSVKFIKCRVDCKNLPKTLIFNIESKLPYVLGDLVFQDTLVFKGYLNGKAIRTSKHK